MTPVTAQHEEVQDDKNAQSKNNEVSKAQTSKNREHPQNENTSSSPCEEKKKKMFFTASDMMEKVNDTMRSVMEEDGSMSGVDIPKVELHHRNPNGTTTRADKNDMKATDLQTKLKQTADAISVLSPEEKIEWAKKHRLEGNRLFSEAEYEEAMDVYMTCLVAIDFKNDDENGASADDAHKTSGENDEDNEPASPSTLHRERIERELQLPVLLNLAACSMRLGQYSKVLQFCNFALQDLTASKCAEKNTKVWYRRGKAKMLMGSYSGAKADFDMALALASSAEEKKAIEKDMKKLVVLTKNAKSNQRKYEKAMKNMFQGDDDGKRVIEGGGLYEDVANETKKRTHSSLVSPSARIKPKGSSNDESAHRTTDISGTIREIGIIGWVLSILTSFFQGALNWLSDTKISSNVFAEKKNKRK